MKWRIDLVLLGVTIAMAATSSVGFRIAFLKSGKVRSEARKQVRMFAPYEPREAVVYSGSEDTWADPVPSSSADGWTYDLFTPPEIFYDADSRRFTVSPPQTALADKNRAAGDARAQLSVRLLAVKPTPFRLQLIGYVGTKAGYLGLFENTSTTETFLAAAGREVAGLDVLIESFMVMPATVRLPEGMSTRQLTATASARDRTTGKVVTLTTTERSYAANPRAVLGIDRGVPQEVCVGDIIDVNGESYEIGEVQLSPPRVEMRRLKTGEAAAAVFTLEIPPGDSERSPLPST